MVKQFKKNIQNWKCPCIDLNSVSKEAIKQTDKEEIQNYLELVY